MNNKSILNFKVIKKRYTGDGIHNYFIANRPISYYDTVKLHADHGRYNPLLKCGNEVVQRLADRDKKPMDKPPDEGLFYPMDSVSVQIVRQASSKMLSHHERQVNQVMGLAKHLADLVMHQVDATSEMKGLAASILGILDVPMSGQKGGRVFADDLRVGFQYLSKGWHTGEFLWTFLGMIPDGSGSMSICRDGKVSKVLLGDYGLAVYNDGNLAGFWHPCNWSAFTGLTEGAESVIMGQAVDAVSGFDEENLDEF